LMDSMDPPRVKVGAGVSIEQLENQINMSGWTMATNVVLTEVFVVGVIGTICHGPGYEYGAIGDDVIEVSLVNYKGEKNTYSTEIAEDKEKMRALRGSLGTIGMITSVTIKVVKLDTLKMTDECFSVYDYFLKKEGDLLKKLVNDQNGWVELFWVPFNDKFWCKSWKTSTKQPDKPGHTISDRLESIFQQLIYRIPAPTGPAGGELVKGFMKFLFSLMTTGFHTRPLVRYWDRKEALHWRLEIDKFKVEDTEFAIYIDEGYENVKRAFRILYDKVNEYSKHPNGGDYPVNITTEIRFGKGSEIYLAPNSGHELEKWCFIEFLRSSVQGNPAEENLWNQFVNDVCQEWMRIPELKARVHWGKGYQNITGVIPHIRKSFGENWEKFKEIRREMDPNLVFTNKHKAELFGDSELPSLSTVGLSMLSETPKKRKIGETIDGKSEEKTPAMRKKQGKQRQQSSV